MFTTDSELSEEDFIRAALTIENDCCQNSTFPLPARKSSESTECPSADTKTGVYQLDKLSSCASKSVSKRESFFCLSQEDDFDDEISDDVLISQIDSVSRCAVSNLPHLVDTNNCQSSLAPVTTASDVPRQQQSTILPSSSSIAEKTSSHSNASSNTVFSRLQQTSSFCLNAGLQLAVTKDRSSPVARNQSTTHPLKKLQTNPVSESFSPYSRRDPSSFRKRKFPGPAGLLPEKPAIGWNESSINAELSISSSKKSDCNAPTSASTDVVSCSQSSVDDYFNSEPWRTMISDLEPNADRILAQFNVRSVLEMAVGRRLERGKVPVFCAIIESVSARGADACITLRDPTGKISGTVHRELIKEYTAYVQPGTAVVLRQVSLLSPLGRNYYLNITSNNVVRLYPRTDLGSSSQAALKLGQLTDSDLVVATPSCVTSASPVLPSNRVEIAALRPVVNNVPQSSVPQPSRPNNYRPMLSTSGRPLPIGPDGWSQMRQQAVSKLPSETSLTRSTDRSIPFNRDLNRCETTLDSIPIAAASNTTTQCRLLGANQKQGTPKFTFRKTGLTSQTSPILGEGFTSTSVGCSNRVDVGSLATTSNSSPVGHKCSATAARNDGWSSSDIWKTDDVDDDMLLNLSAEFLSDF